MIVDRFRGPAGLSLFLGMAMAALAARGAAPPSPSITHTGNFYQGQSNAVSLVTVTTGQPTTSGVNVAIFPDPHFNVTAINAVNWSCNLVPLSCSRPDLLASGSFEAIQLIGTVAANAPATITNSVTLSGGGLPSSVQASDTATVEIPSGIVQWGNSANNQTLGGPPLGTGFVAISSEGFQSLALKNDGTIVQWGDTSLGEAVGLPAGSGFVAIAAGYYHNLGLKSDGTIVQWGATFLDQTLGGPPAGSGFVAIAAGGYHSLALKSDGSIVQWGNAYGLPPVGSGFVAIAAGGFHSLALKSDGTIVQWGDASRNQTNNLPVGSGFVAIAAGGLHSLALKSDGTIVQWGDTTSGNQAVGLPTGSGFVAIAAGLYHSLALKGDGTIVQWGDASENQAAGLPGGAGFAAIAAGYLHSLALLPVLNVAPSITQNPLNQAVPAGSSASFFASASGSPVPTVQWQVSTDGLNFTDISGATSATLSFTAQSTDTGKQYRARFSNTVAINVATSPATLTITTPAVTGFALKSPAQRNDFPGFAGMQLTVGARSLSVYSLGRVCVAGNAQTHTVKLVDASTNIDVPGGSAPVNMANCTPGTFVYTDLTSPVTLPPGASYYLASQEFLNGDNWYEHSAITTTADISVTNSVYLSGATWLAIDGPNTSYVPPGLRYAASGLVVPAFVLNYQHDPVLRNNYSGFVGMALTTATNPVNVSAVGRVCVAGNTQSHTVKFVNALTGLDVPGGSASVNMNNCTSGRFVYTTLPGGPLSLAANTAYYLVTQETSGGDQWYDLGTTVQTTNVASVTSAVYSSATGYVSFGTAGHTYGPVDFQYSGTSGGGPSITQQPQSTIVVAGQTANFSVTATDGAGLNYQWQSKPSGAASFSNILGANGSGYTTPVTIATDDGTQFRAVVSNGVGSVTSNPATMTVETIPNINPQPQNAIVTTGQTATFSVTATGGGLTYQWQSMPSGAPSFSNITGAISSSYTTSATAAANNNSQFRVVVTNLAGPVTSNPATLTVQQPAGTSFVTSKTLGTIRNNYDGMLGMVIKVGANAVTVNSLGRIMVSGNSGSHIVKIVDSTGTDVPGGSIAVSMHGGTPGNFVYANLASPVTLNAGATYYIVSKETAGGDQWYDFDTALLTTSVATITSAVYGNGSYIPIGTAGHSYAPVDFQYGGSGGGGPSITQQPQSTIVTAGQTANFSVTATGAGLTYQWQSQPSGAASFSDIGGAVGSSYTTPVTTVADNATQFRVVVSGTVTSNAATLTVLSGGSPTAFVTSTSLGGRVRNDYDGFVGMAIRVGSSPLTVTSVGRMVTSGNSSTHVVKFVDSAGVDVPGGSANVNAASGSARTFAYATLSAPITLSPNTTYYLVSKETAGGDTWIDYFNTTLQTTSVASIIGPIYSQASGYIFVSGYPGSSYVPVDFKYQ
jgi:hypothetical protein